MKFLLFTVVAFSSFLFSQEANPPAENIPHEVTVSWTLPTGTYQTLNIYRADSCNNFVYLKNIGKNSKNFIDREVIGGAIYKYKLRSVNNGIESVDSVITIASVPYN